MRSEPLSILPVREADGEGDRLKGGGGARGAFCPSTSLRLVPLPIAAGDREEQKK